MLMCSPYKSLTILTCAATILIACEQEQPVHTVREFLENPIKLEAAMVRCSADRDGSRYDAECINALAAVSQIEAKEEAARRAEFEARSDSKRQALRQAQEAAAEARRRAAEAERLRREAEYLAQFGVALPPDTPMPDDDTVTPNSPLAVIPGNDSAMQTPTDQAYSEPPAAIPAEDGNNAPVVTSEPVAETVPTDLESIRDELQRRKDEQGNN